MGFLKRLFTPRPAGPASANSLGAVDFLVLSTYTAILCFAVPHHLPWADEAQAWLIARDSTLHDLLFRRLHYEGAPALWPLILWSASRLGLPYPAIGWLGVPPAIAGVFLLLRYSPFPPVFRWILPFTFFLQYQYAVIARPYVLFPVLLFACCGLSVARNPKPVWFAACAGLLANISLHAAVLAFCFALLYAWRVRRSVSPRRLFAAAMVFLGLCLAFAVVAFPAPDGAFAVSDGASHGPVHSLLLKLLPEQRLPPSAPPLDPPVAVLAAPRGGIAFAGVRTLVLGANALTYPIARSNLLALAFLFALVLWLRARGHLRLLLPFLVGILASVQIWVYDHHTGMFLLSLLAAVWMSLDLPAVSAGVVWGSPALACLSLAVALPQIGWTVHCIRAERHAPYDPGRATARFLATRLAGQRVAGFAYESVSTQACFPRSVFMNQPNAYWLWSRNVLADRRRSETLASLPQAVVVGEFHNESEVLFRQWIGGTSENENIYRTMVDFWLGHGFVEVARFCGERFIRMGASTSFCEIVLVPPPAR